MDYISLKLIPDKHFVIPVPRSSAELRARTTLSYLYDNGGLLKMPATGGITFLYEGRESALSDKHIAQLVLSMAKYVESEEHRGAVAVADADAGWGMQPNLMALGVEDPEEVELYLNNYFSSNRRWLADHPKASSEIQAIYASESRGLHRVTV